MFVINSFSQNKQILYNLTSVPQSLLTNPGSDFKYDWYIGVPLLSGISANVGSSGFSAYDLFANNGVDFNVKLRNVVFSTTREDKLAINEQVEILNGGFKIAGELNDTYVSFGMYQEFDALSYIPKDLAILALDGNKDYLGKVFNLGDLSAKAEMVSVFHIGFHKIVMINLFSEYEAKFILVFTTRLLQIIQDIFIRFHQIQACMNKRFIPNCKLTLLESLNVMMKVMSLML